MDAEALADRRLSLASLRASPGQVIAGSSATYRGPDAQIAEKHRDPGRQQSSNERGMVKSL